MTATLSVFADWLRHTSISEAIRVLPWLWPVCEIVHFFGLSLLIGVVGFFDLCLLGFMPAVPIGAAWSLMPWAKVGFVLSAMTGLTFFVGAPDQYVHNVAFLGKLVFLAVAGVNAVCFETMYAARLAAVEAGERPPGAFKFIAGVSLVSWFLVVYWGRMLPFIGNAF